MVRPGKERAAAADIDDAETQVTTQDARWLAGVNRQAHEDAHLHQVAASHAAAAKRKAKAMSEAEKAAALQRYAAKRNEKKRQKRAAAHAASSCEEEDVAAAVAALLAAIVSEVAEACDEVDEEELEEELKERIIERCGSPWLMDTRTREVMELELRMEGYGAARGDDGPQVYSLPYDELQRRVADGELARPGEEQMAWDQRVLRDRLARGATLGAHLEELQRLQHEPPYDPIADHALANHSSQPDHWQPQGAELRAPPPPPPPPPVTLPAPPPADDPSRCVECRHILPIWGCDSGCECLHPDLEALSRHKAFDCSPACTPRWSQLLVNVVPGSAEPCVYCAKYAAGRCMAVDDVPNQETLQQQRRRELEAQASVAPQPPPPPSVGATLLMAEDEGVPYYYTKDTARTLASKHELLDTSVSNPEWMRDAPPEQLGLAQCEWPPERSDYALGDRGQRAYRRDRARWYTEHTGKELNGSIAEQNEQWDDYKRNFRARGDRERAVQPAADAPPPNPERYAGPPGHYLYD